MTKKEKANLLMFLFGMFSVLTATIFTAAGKSTSYTIIYLLSGLGCMIFGAIDFIRSKE